MRNRSKIKWFGVATIVFLLSFTTVEATSNKLIQTLTFDTLDGTTTSLQSLQSLQGKTVLILFWATTCPVCLEEMPDFIRIYKQFHKKGLEIIAVSMSYDSPQAVNQYKNKMNLPFPVVWDSKEIIAKAFGDITLTPTVFLIDPNGQPISKTVGFLDFILLEKYLTKQLNQ